MEKKVSLRALIQERVKVLREGKLVKSDKPLELPKRMKELVEKAKLARKENKGTKSAPVSLREKMLSHIEEIKKQQLNKKEVSHD